MVKHRRRKLDARQHQAEFGGSYQAAAEAVRKISRGLPLKARPAPVPTPTPYGASFRTWLTSARKAAAAGDIATVVHIAETQLGLNVRVGPEFAGTLLLHGAEFDRADDSQLPGVVRRLLRGDTGPDRPVWKRRVQGARVFLHSELTHELLDQASAYEPTMPTGGLPEDPRVQFILDGLSAMERDTLLAWYTSGVATWREAAEVAGAPQDPRFTERVRRQVRRLAENWGTAA